MGEDRYSMFESADVFTM